MTTGSQSDVTNRLQQYLPRGWFGDFSQTPNLNGVLAAIASTFSAIYAFVLLMWAQTRLQTSSAGWVDMWAADFFGTNLPRNVGETDAAFVARIQAALFQPRGTRPAMVSVLTNLTGQAPIIFEPMNPIDTGCLGKNTGVNSFCGVARMGSLAAPFSALITAFRPKVAGGLAGAAYTDAAAWSALNTSVSHGYMGSLSQETTIATDAAIYAAINATRPVATNIGVCIINVLPAFD